MIFTALHLCSAVLAMSEVPVHLLKRLNCDKTKEICFDIFTPHERSFILVFWQEEQLVGNDPLYVKFWVLKFWVKLTRLEQKCRSSINTNRKDTTRFPMSLR